MNTIRKFIFSFFILYYTFFLSQQQVDTEKKRIFDSLDHSNITKASTIFENGKEMLKYAQNDYELSQSYLLMGDGMYKEGNYKSAVPLLEKADKYAKVANKRNHRIAIISLLVDTYRFAGLPSESDAMLKEIEKITDKNDESEKALVLQAKARILEIDNKFCEAIPIRKKELNLYENSRNPNIQQKKEMLIFANIHSAYLKIKCGQQDEALHNLHVAEDIYKELGDKKPTYYIENYYLVKALISLNEKDKRSAKDWFTKSFKTAKQTENKMVIKKILYEMRDSNIFNTPTEKNEITEALLVIQNLQTEVTKQTTENEILKKNQKLRNEEDNLTTSVGIISVLVLGIIFLIIYNKERNKRIYAKYLKITKEAEIKDIQKSQITPINESYKPIDANIDNEFSKREPKIFKQLEQLEENLFFTAKNMSATQLAALLKITPRNLSYILKKYRNDDFYNYLNTLRIVYFIHILNENPKYLNYKIAALADMCGYNSYSQFAVNFKAKTEISPSQYISLLKKRSAIKI